ncbi:Uncharacterised protein [Streptococcus agalactiae]|nr:Uncharacterised protein [Streptococcus agalactiae]CNG51527.1 Uncharacterised protein [Streptococcus agalactiae]
MLAPMLVENQQVIEDMRLKRDTLRSWRPAKRLNVYVLVAFIPVYSEEYNQTERIYKDAVENFLNEFRTRKSKNIEEIISYEAWIDMDESTLYSSTEELEEFMFAEMLQDLLEKVKQADKDLYDITLGLLAKEFDESIEDVFIKIGVKRSTGFYRLPKARALVAALLKELNPK